MQFGFIFALIISILIAIFAIQNGNVVTIDLFFASFQVSQAIVILISTVFGAIIAAMLGSIGQFKSFSTTKELKAKIKLIESENQDAKKSITRYENDIQLLSKINDEFKEELSKIKGLNEEKFDELKDGFVENTDDTTDAYLEENDEKGQAES